MANTSSDAEPGSPQSATRAPVAALRRLPGKARPREEALREYEDANAKRREGIPAPLWPFWAPNPDEFYRWRVQLDCGCVKEVLTGGDKRLPAESQWFDHVHRVNLPAGQLLCTHDDSPAAPYRDIVEWESRREVLIPASPPEPPDGMDAETWALLRSDEPRTKAFWTVTLSCGHVTEAIAPDLGWKPADGPRTVGADRLREMTAEFEEFWASEPNGQEERERGHTKRMLAQGWPTPEPEKLCYTCPSARPIVAYQRIGWLVPRTPEPKPPKQPSRATLERRLRQAQTEVARLQDQLAQVDTQQASQRTATDE
jgi:hypothetical protein